MSKQLAPSQTEGAGNRIPLGEARGEYPIHKTINTPAERMMRKMNLRKKWIFLCFVILIAAVCFAGCRGRDVYEEQNKAGYTVSVRYDACGGEFTDAHTPVIVDCYNLSQYEKNADGMVALKLHAPQNRNDVKMNNGDDQFLVGWYKQCTKNADGTYTYAEPWDFQVDSLVLDPNQEYNSEVPSLTLYAAWAPKFTVEYYTVGEENPLFIETVTPEVKLQIPTWDEKNGTLNMGQFPKREGYTYQAAYYDAECKIPVEGTLLEHTGSLDRETAVAENPTMKIYLAWREGNWYKISTAKQFQQNFNLNGCYDIQNDLDFSDAIWPTAYMHGEFAGKIMGNGYTIRNVSIEQTDAKRMNTGLFGALTETASICDIKFENINLTIKTGFLNNGTCIGLFAGTVKAGANVQDVTIKGSTISVDPGAVFASPDFRVGLVCGSGELNVDDAGITVKDTAGLLSDIFAEDVPEAADPEGTEESEQDETEQEETTLEETVDNSGDAA